ncbi:uncharacterized protein A4U43_C05F20170 [Asparagus officinalis]|uniref:Amino acid transporter transmembrane domain-containing protein n=1 Tax=Asparagus officinalis TaxID=4686 RepID=A0A5P1EYE4_ASPOF|nr:uncharacterized protein A4U43_C05F20170 [Asparagus officinalis]
MGSGNCEFRPLGFLLGLPFAFLSLFISMAGAIVWMYGVMITVVCTCCPNAPKVIERGHVLMRTPIRVMRWFMETIPC